VPLLERFYIGLPQGVRNPLPDSRGSWWRSVAIQNKTALRKQRKLIRHASRQRGSVYVLVLGVCMIVTVIGLSAVLAARIQHRGREIVNDTVTARGYAESGIDLAMLKIKQDANWRSTYTHDTWTADQDIDRGTFRWKLVDTVDTDLNNNTTDTARLVAWGILGNTTQKVSVLLEPIGGALSCLAAAAHANGNINTGASDTFTVTGAPLSTNATLNNDAILNGNVDANATTGTGTINGTVNTPAPPKDMPSSSSVFDFYTSNGTTISYAGLPSIFGGKVIENTVLSPTNNPWGTTNPSGIYVIDCQGSTITIRNCRIVGTLVLLDPSIFSAVNQSVIWEPAISSYPSLLVRGSIALALTNTNLDEAALTTNFNPVGTPYPYPTGTENATQGDLYPSQMNGLVYASGRVTLQGNTTIQGVVVADGEISHVFFSTDLPNLTYRNTFLNDPPPGFMDGSDVRIMAGSWRQEVD